MCLYLASVNQCQYFNVHTSHSQCVLSWEQYQIFVLFSYQNMASIKSRYFHLVLGEITCALIHVITRTLQLKISDCV